MNSTENGRSPASRTAFADLSLSRRRRLAAAAACGVIGLIALVAGFVGVSGTRLISDQLSYLASGSVVGLGLLGLGAMLLIADFMLEQEAAIGELRELVVALHDEAPAPALNGHAVVGGGGPAGATSDGLVAVPGARRVHRASCTLVAGKAKLEEHRPTDVVAAGLQPCRVCNPDLPVAVG